MRLRVRATQLKLNDKEFINALDSRGDYWKRVEGTKEEWQEELSKVKGSRVSGLDSTGDLIRKMGIGIDQRATIAYSIWQGTQTIIGAYFPRSNYGIIAWN